MAIPVLGTLAALAIVTTSPSASATPTAPAASGAVIDIDGAQYTASGDASLQLANGQVIGTRANGAPRTCVRMETQADGSLLVLSSDNQALGVVPPGESVIIGPDPGERGATPRRLPRLARGADGLLRIVPGLAPQVPILMGSWSITVAAGQPAWYGHYKCCDTGAPNPTGCGDEVSISVASGSSATWDCGSRYIIVTPCSPTSTPC